MRILFLANDGEGLYKFRKEIIQELLKVHEVFVSLPEDAYIPYLKELGCTYVETEFNRKGTNPIKDLKLLSAYRKMIRNVQPDVVITYTIKPNVYGGMACQMEGVPYISNITGLGSAVEKKGLLQILTCTLYKIGLKKAQRVFFQNTTNMLFMLDKKIIRKQQTRLVPGSGVNTDEYRVSEYPKGDTVDFVYVGRMMKEKGFGLYLDAAREIHDRHQETRFHVCGAYEDDYRREVEELSAEGTIIYHGSVKNMTEIYKNIHCTIHPTYYPEGLSNVLLESLACGRPIITTDRPGCREVVEDGINGFIVRQKDLQDLIDKIEKFLSLSYDEKKQMGINGRNKVERDFNRKTVIGMYLEEIDKVK